MIKPHHSPADSAPRAATARGRRVRGRRSHGRRSYGRAVGGPGPRRIAWIGCVAGLVLGGVGCAPAGSRLEITSYKDPYFPERFTLALDECGYRTDLHGDYHVAGFVSAALDQPDEIVDQYLTLQIYWRPRPGKTGDHASLNDAVIRYAIVTPRGAAVYKGTAYAYPRRSGGDQRVRFELENARLRLEHAVGDAPEILGQARITGAIDARLDPARAVRYANEVSRLAALPRWPDPPQP